MSNKSKIIIDASSRILYTSFYIKGLYDVFGKKNVTFSATHFTDLNRHTNQFSFEHYFAFKIIDSNGSIKKVVVDFCDSLDVNKNAIEWCNFYAKINFNFNDTNKDYLNKIILIPPGFGIKIWNKRNTLYHCLSNLMKSNFSTIVPFKRYFQDYYYQYKRPSLNQYTKSDGLKNNDKIKPYIFLIATLWDESHEKTNLERKTFIEMVKSKHYDFEGGFLATDTHPKINEYREHLFTKPYSSKDYVIKTKQSEFVFNTPAVHNCHGWKLPEYLAMGKAILSTPLSNELTENLKSGINIHIVNDKDALNLGIELLKNDKEYRNLLEQNATIYYEKFIKPQAVIETILNFIYPK